MLRIFSFVIFYLFSSSSHAEKYALIVAVGNYPEKSGWASINSLNDVDIIKDCLIIQGFKKQFITSITDKNGTRENIIYTLQSIKEKLTKGDIFVVHFSMHGQQIFDDSGDELDHLDEALVPYDAASTYSEFYKGENHLRDDDLAIIIADLRQKLGETGELLMILDSCHSGTSSRGGKPRGGVGALKPPNWEFMDVKESKGSDMYDNLSNAKNISKFIMISGARAKELNFEYEGYGSLSYAFSKALNILGSEFTYRQLFNKITTIMASIAPQQQPVIEGDIDYKLFNGDYVKQQPFYTIKSIINPKLITVNAGTIQLFNKATTVYVMPSGSSNFDENLSLAKGVVSRSFFNQSHITLDNDLPDNITQNYIIFTNQLALADMHINLYLDTNLPNDIEQKLSIFLTSKTFIVLVKKSINADFSISYNNGYYNIQKLPNSDLFDNSKKNEAFNSLENLYTSLYTFAQGKYLRDLDLKDPTFEFSFKLIPLTLKTNNIDTKTETNSKILGENSIFQVNTTGDTAVLEVTNHSNKDLYFSILEIYTDGKILPFMPNKDCEFSDDDRFIPRRSKQIIKGCLYQFTPPFERIVLKAFATTSPINLEPLLTGNNTRSDINPIVNFIKKNYNNNTSRGGNGSDVNNGQLKGYTSEFIYEIVN